MDDLERIQAALNNAGVEVRCLACGSPSHTIDPYNPAALPALSGSELQLDRAISAVTVICTNCGFIRLHKTDYLLGDRNV